MSLLAKIHKHLIVEMANRFFSSIALSAMVAPALRLLGASIGSHAHIYSPLILHNTRFSRLTVGDNCHIGRGVFLDLDDRIDIGDNVTISMNVTLLTHLDLGKSPLGDKGFASETAPVTIRSGAYIGAGATILHGVTIGENSAVAAGAVVREDVPPGSLVAGVPGRVIRKIEGSDQS